MSSGITSTALCIRSLAAWLALLVLAFVNGGFRELVLVPRLGYPWALLLSGLLLCACVLALAWLTVVRLSIDTTRHLVTVGALWLALTLLFEFSFGRLVQGKPWSELLGAYTFARGNLWPVVLLVILVGPLAVHRVRSAIRARPRQASRAPGSSPGSSRPHV